MRASDRAYAILLDEIQSGILAPGTVLGEVDQSIRLGVSRTPLREALARLQADGLVMQLSARVTVVTAVDADDIRALFEIRRALEVTAVTLAAERGDRALFAQIAARFAAASVENEQARGDYEALIAAFDAAVDAAAGNIYLSQALRTVRTHLVRVRRLARDRPSRLAASVAEHRAIAEAIADGDPALAAAATQLHLHAALRSILDALASAEPAPTGAIPALPALEGTA